jgi:type II secretory pathway pseudopilin PulG
MIQPEASSNARPTPSTARAECADQPPSAVAAHGQKRRPALLALMTVAVASAAGITWWQRSHQQSGANTLEPVPAATSILIPDEGGPDTAPVGPKAPAAQASAPGASDPKGDSDAPLRAGIEQLKARVAALEDAGRAQAEQITALRNSLDQISARQAERAAERAPQAVQANAAPTRSRRPAATAGASQKQPTASVLAIDLWGGQPSVVVSKDGADGAELRFISPGETQGRVTLKSADVANQRATFATSAGEFTMSAGDR